MKRQLRLILVVAFVAFSAGVGRGQYSGPCDWKFSDEFIAGCNGTDTQCNQGCNTLCNGFAKVVYYNPKTIMSGGSYQKTTNQVQLACKKNKNCGNYSIGSRRCSSVEGVANCDTVDVTESCSYCQVTSQNVVYVDGYNLRECPTE